MWAAPLPSLLPALVGTEGSPPHVGFIPEGCDFGRVCRGVLLACVTPGGAFHFCVGTGRMGAGSFLHPRGTMAQKGKGSARQPSPTGACWSPGGGLALQKNLVGRFVIASRCVFVPVRGEERLEGAVSVGSWAGRAGYGRASLRGVGRT